MIQTRRLGKNGPEVSAIALGTRNMSTNKEARESENIQTIDTIQAAIDAGINFLNTADFYGMGQNEMLIGEAIKGRRDKVSSV
jgi:aryl-alcohol dehydrogenase-like predicted oxidoreductase